jgi:hypothetical protein
MAPTVLFADSRATSSRNALLERSSSVVAVDSLWNPSASKAERSSITIVREDLEAMALSMLTPQGWPGTACFHSTGTALLLQLKWLIPLLR